MGSLYNIWFQTVYLFLSFGILPAWLLRQVSSSHSGDFFPPPGTLEGSFASPRQARPFLHTYDAYFFLSLLPNSSQSQKVPWMRRVQARAPAARAWPQTRGQDPSDANPTEDVQKSAVRTPRAAGAGRPGQAAVPVPPAAGARRHASRWS